MTCSKCPVKIVYRRHVRTNKSAPIEVEPVAKGNIRLIDEGHYEVITKDNPARPGERLFLNHHVTCEAVVRRRRSAEVAAAD